MRTFRIGGGSLSLNWALMAAGLVDRVQVTVFPVITGKPGTDPVFGGAADSTCRHVLRRRLFLEPGAAPAVQHLTAR